MGNEKEGNGERLMGSKHTIYVYKTVKNVLTLKVVEASEQHCEPLNYMIDKLYAL